MHMQLTSEPPYPAVGELLVRVGGAALSATTRSRTGAVGLDDTELRTGPLACGTGDVVWERSDQAL